MPDQWTRVAAFAGALALVAIVAALYGWADRPPADVGRGAVAVARGSEGGGSADRADVAGGADRVGGAGRAAPRPAAPPDASAPEPVGRRTAVVPAAPVRILPVAVALPRLGVRASIDPVGVEADGSMTVPGDGDRVGWYRFGAAPGDPAGSAVLAGHVDTRRGGPGAFYPLSGVQVGDEIVLDRDDGSRLRYRVVGRELLVKTALPVDAIFDRSGPERLTLVTCGGPFRPEVRSYRDNLVITAERMA